MSRLLHTALMALGLAACSDPKALSLEVTPGHESDAFTMDPAVTRVSITALGADDSELLKSTTEPGGGFTLGELPVDQLVRFEVRGTDADGDLRMRGRSLGLVLGSIESEVFPVFAQRIDAWARPPGELPHSSVDGLADVLGERYLVLTGGTAIDGEPTTVLFYDMLSLGGVTGGELTSVPKSMAVVQNGRALLLVDDERAVWLDFDAGTSVELAAPEGLGPFANVAGGRTVRSPEATFIVGATRAGEPTDRVLVISGTGSLSVARLNTPRSEAAASWVEGVGLVVIGGADEGAGVEVIADGETDADDLPFTADPTRGAVATLGPAGEQLLLLCGEDAAGPAPVRLFDLDCGATCEAAPLEASMGMLTNCTAFTNDEDVFVAGHDEEGIMQSYALDPIDDAVIAIPLREERRGARMVAAPNGTLAVIGGEHPDGSPALTVETFFPGD